ncbi:hypothetical protein [Streptomyces sp. NPDC057682]|uniref:InlB B-repeat-containing protein n=1 Tax=Streptomyces sp. NPDC057682 TaxID=3346210 RepID=UPI0036BBE34B
MAGGHELAHPLPDARPGLPSARPQGAFLHEPVPAEPGDGGTVAVARFGGDETEPGRYEKGSRVTFTAHPAPGRVLTGWTVNGETVAEQGPFLALTADVDLTVTACFTPGPR